MRNIIASIFLKRENITNTQTSECPEKTGILRKNNRARVALVTILGVEEKRVDEIINVTQSALKEYDKIVYLTDSPNFHQFRTRQLAFEYWPSPHEINLHGQGLDWNNYLTSKKALLMSKWSVSVVVAYGVSIEDRISSLKSS